MSKNKEKPTICPICETPFEKEEQYKFTNVRTKHHIFPKLWYKDGIRVYACSLCHTYGFHKMYPMETVVWTPSECVQKWVKFCKSKGKDAYVIYPELCSLQPLY